MAEPAKTCRRHLMIKVVTIHECVYVCFCALLVVLLDNIGLYGQSALQS